MNIETENSEIIFLVSMFLLGVLNIITYPYMPFNGLLLTLFFLSLSSIAVVLEHRRSRSLSFYWILLSSFNLTVLFSKVFVNTAGIGTPRSTGSLGPVPVEQLWIDGLHVHHYWLGVLLIAVAVYMFKTQFSKIKTAAFLGSGLALVVDEFGIIIAGHSYHSNISYISLAAANTFLFILFVRSESSAESVLEQYISVLGD